MAADKAVIVGKIEDRPGCAAIDGDLWLKLIAEHPCLSPVPPETRINPFTRLPFQYHAPATSAIAFVDGRKIGSISLDIESPTLMAVVAENGSAEIMMSVAEEIATRLGGVFTPWSSAW